MITWNNLDTLEAFKNLSKAERVNIAEAMSGENGAERVKTYSVPMAEGLAYNYAAKQVDDKVLEDLQKLADEAQLTEKFEALYNGEVINTGEKRMVLHHLTRGQLGEAVNADGTDKRAFYKEQQQKIADFANKAHVSRSFFESEARYTQPISQHCIHIRFHLREHPALFVQRFPVHSPYDDQKCQSFFREASRLIVYFLSG